MVVNTCVVNKDKLSNVALNLNTLRVLVHERNDKRKIQHYMTIVDNELNEIGESILDIDDAIGKLSITLNELQEEGALLASTSTIVADPNTGKVSMTQSLESLYRRYKRYQRKLEYYCHVHASLKHQIEAQRIANDIRRMGFDPFEFGDEGDKVKMRKEAMKVGPHFSKLLDDLVNER